MKKEWMAATIVFLIIASGLTLAHSRSVTRSESRPHAIARATRRMHIKSLAMAAFASAGLTQTPANQSTKSVH